MKRLHMRVISSPPLPRFSVLTARSDNQIWRLGVTVELPWLSNAPGLSCVPPGAYGLIDHVSGTKNKWCDGRVLALVNPSLGVTLDGANGTRDHCYIHSLNYPHESLGCVGPGLDFHPERWGVSDSRKACQEIFKFFDNGFTQLIIE